MGATLTIANEQQAYTLADRATYLARKKEGLELEILVEGDSRLFNPYGVITVNPEKHPTVNVAGAQTFTEWLTSLETQQLISQFGVADFGQSLFIPDSEQWRAAKQE
jgi:tungstate transport system substrate-binding protein